MYVYLLLLNDGDRCPAHLREGGLNACHFLRTVLADSIFESAARDIQFLQEALLKLH